MSRRSDDDDLPVLLDELSGTLDRLQTELGDDRRRPDRSARRRGRDEADDRPGPRRRRERHGPSIPRPGRFLEFTEEYTIPALIAFLEANIRALELLQGLLRLLRGGEVSERRVESVGRRTLGQVDNLLSDVQGALEGQPSNPEARDLLDEARSLRGEIDDRIAGGAIRREGEERSRSRGRDGDDDRVSGNDVGTGRRGRDTPVSIDVSDDDRRENDRDRGGRRGEDRRDGERARRDEVDVDSELDSLRRQVRGDDDPDEAGGDGPADGADDENGENEE